ncbi:MAG: GNAT family N-acetyltransferase [Longimicrobiales bacterium]
MIRTLDPDERAAVVRVLSEAFADYPVMRFVLGGDPMEMPDGLAALVGFFTDVRYAMGWPVLGVEADGRLVAATLVNEPTDAPFLDRFQDGLARVRAALGEEAYARLEAFEHASEGNEPDGDYYFMGMLGVLPGYQRQGFGRMLLRHVEAMASDAGCGVALSTEDARNVPFYEDLGYRVIGQADIGELHTWGFYRPADAGGSSRSGAAPPSLSEPTPSEE